MAVESRLNKVTVNMKLNNGTRDGKVVTLNQSIGSLSITDYDDQKAMNIVDALNPCLAKNVMGATKTEVSDLVKSE